MLRTYTKDHQPSEVEFLEGALLLIDKPLEWTSFDAVNKLRHTIRHTLNLKKKRKVKVGHAGTLDPMATGLLLICTGKYTKKINDLTGLQKTYEGTLKLGATTPTYDSEAEEDQTFDVSHITEEAIHAATEKFMGDIWQKPPIYSAVRMKGEKLYNLARRGEEVEIEPRPVSIYDFKITAIEMPYVTFEVTCSKGTYIRSLAHHFGASLDSGAYLSALRRTYVDEYAVSDAMSVEEAVAWIRESAIYNEPQNS